MLPLSLFNMCIYILGRHPLSVHLAGALHLESENCHKLRDDTCSRAESLELPKSVYVHKVVIQLCKDLFLGQIYLLESVAVRKDSLKISQFQPVTIVTNTLSNCVLYFYVDALCKLPSISNYSNYYVCIWKWIQSQLNVNKTDKISTWCETDTLLSFQRSTPEGVYKFPMCFEN